MARPSCLPLMLCLASAALIAADAPTTTPSVEKRTLLNGQIEYTPPAGWTFSEKNASEESAVFVSPDRSGMLLMLVQPDKMHPDVQVARAIIQKIKEDRKNKPDIKYVQEPKIEPSKDFEIRISEEYTHEGKTYARLYLYRLRGKRTVAVTVTALNAPDAEAKRATLKVGEETLLSVKWPKKK